jgi:hypothetical protein
MAPALLLLPSSFELGEAKATGHVVVIRHVIIGVGNRLRVGAPMRTDNVAQHSRMDYLYR